MIGPDRDARQCTKREGRRCRRKRTSARSSGAVMNESEVGNKSGGEGGAGQDRVGETGTGTAEGRQHSNRGTSRRGGPTCSRVEDRAAYYRDPEKGGKRGGEVQASDRRVVQVGAGLRRNEREGRLERWSKGTEGKAREAEKAEAERGTRRSHGDWSQLRSTPAARCPVSRGVVAGSIPRAALVGHAGRQVLFQRHGDGTLATGLQGAT